MIKPTFSSLNLDHISFKDFHGIYLFVAVCYEVRCGHFFLDKLINFEHETVCFTSKDKLLVFTFLFSTSRSKCFAVNFLFVAICSIYFTVFDTCLLFLMTVLVRLEQ